MNEYFNLKTGSEDMLVPGSKYNITEESIGDFRFVTTLHITGLNSADFYEYQCVAKVSLNASLRIRFWILNIFRE